MDTRVRQLTYVRFVVVSSALGVAACGGGATSGGVSTTGSIHVTLVLEGGQTSFDGGLSIWTDEYSENPE